MNLPLISIILPTYNGSLGIERAIKSVLCQYFTDWELVVIDDGSTDDMRELILNLQKQDNRIIYKKNEKNLGIQQSLNRGLKESKGTYIARIDDDDEWIDPDKLVKQVDFLDCNKDYVLVGTNAIICDEKGREVGRYILQEDDLSIRARMLSRNCFIHPSIVARREAIEKAGGYSERETVKHIEDYELWLRLGSIGKIANIKTPSVRITVHPNSLTFQNRIIQAKRMRTVACQYRKKYPHFLLGQAILLLRISGFIALKLIPLPKKVLYKIQKLYKEY